MWRVGALPATDGPQLPVPGERRTVPLYLVAPEAQRGLRARVRFFRWLLASLVTLTTAIWGPAFWGDSVSTLLANLTSVTLLIAMATWAVADSMRPSTRPYSSDVDRW
ncbi:hypothetical protein Cch01nite_18590 [Cellulomonas chitinilytica]|uniref:Uncharacterized protein n=1 Tax=Cellulomonas chitinilytica TaxID=398759 RepID=A0A919P2P5_9CELL|nr:hypothetical protein Cch01nite_18590 [Cellulomonas chitinilytica]